MENHPKVLLNSPYRSRFENEMKRTEWAKLFTAKHLEPGVVTYDQADGSKKTYLLTREAIAKMRPTAEGKPIVGKSGDFDHKSVKPTDFQEGEVDGVVVEGFDSGDGWDSIRFMVWEPETKSRCLAAHDNGDDHQISCAYVPTETDEKPGLWHNVPYDEVILSGEYTHFAIVPNPRYEGAVILANSMKKGGIVNKVLKSVLSLVPVAELREIVNSIESDQEEAKKIDAEKAAAEVKKNADPKCSKCGHGQINHYDEGKLTYCAVQGPKKGDKGGTGTCGCEGDGKFNALPNAAPVDYEGKALSKKQLDQMKSLGLEPSKQKDIDTFATVHGWGLDNAAPPDPAVEGAGVLAKEKQPEAGTEAASPEGKAKAAANDGDAPAVRPEPGVAGAIPGPAANADPVTCEKCKKVECTCAAPVPEKVVDAVAEYEAAIAAAVEAFKVDGDKAKYEAAASAALDRRMASDPKPAANAEPVKPEEKPVINAEPSKEDLEKANALRRQERLNALKKLALKNTAAKEALRKQYFEDLRNAAELRGARSGSCELGVTTSDDKQDLGRSRYGS